MKVLRLSGLLACLVLAASVSAGDLTKIERTVAKEPVYKNQPKYCLLVFGPEAMTRVWVVLDGDTLYIDKNGDGDLTAPDERIPNYAENFKPLEIAGRDGQHYLVKRVQVLLVKKNKPTLFHADVQIKGKYWQYGRAKLSDRPATGGIGHFHGPLKIDVSGNEGLVLSKLSTGSAPAKLSVLVGTIDDARGGWVVVPNHFDGLNDESNFPADAHPVAEVEFPPKKPGSPPILTRYQLKERC